MPSSPAVRRHSWKLIWIIGLYAVVLAASITVLVADASHGARLPLLAKAVIALAPLVPALLVVPWTIHQFRLMDEMQVRHQLEALAAASGATALLALGYGFLEVVGFPRLSMFVVWSTFNALWVVAVWVQRWRFR